VQPLAAAGGAAPAEEAAPAPRSMEDLAAMLQEAQESGGMPGLGDEDASPFRGGPSALPPAFGGGGGRGGIPAAFGRRNKKKK